MSQIKKRQDDLRKSLLEQKVNAFIISRPENIFYLSGFSGTTADLLISKDKAVLVTDFRYRERANEEVSEAEIETSPDILDKLEEVVKSLDLKSVAVETHFLVQELYEEFKTRLAPVVIRSASKVVERLREIKDEEELLLMTESAKISSAAFSHIFPYIRAGVAEEEVALELLSFLYGHGVEKMAFEVIVASGVRSAMPHAKTSQRRISTSDFVTIDLGVVYKGYYSDMTRTVVVGKASDKQREIYELVKTAQARAFEAIEVGKTGAEIDQMVRDFFTKTGQAEYFLHNLGHGVGLEIHERPLLGAKEKDVLKEGMVFTVEPGLYISGFGGVRIEDMVVLKQDGPEILTKYSRELIEL